MRLIDADELNEIRRKVICGKIKVRSEYDMIDLCPTIEAEPVRHGKWEEFECDYDGTPSGYYCSECGHAELFKYPYCNCGAKMDGDK